MKAAINEAKQGLREGGIPIGSVLVKDGKIIIACVMREESAGTMGLSFTPH